MGAQMYPDEYVEFRMAIFLQRVTIHFMFVLGYGFRGRTECRYFQFYQTRRLSPTFAACTLRSDENLQRHRAVSMRQRGLLIVAYLGRILENTTLSLLSTALQLSFAV